MWSIGIDNDNVVLEAWIDRLDKTLTWSKYSDGAGKILCTIDRQLRLLLALVLLL